MRVALACGVALAVLLTGSAAGSEARPYRPLGAEVFIPLVHRVIPLPGLSDPSVGLKSGPRASVAVKPAPVVKPRPVRVLRASVRADGKMTGTATWYCHRVPPLSGCMAIHPSGPYAAAGPLLRAAIGGGDHCRPGPGCWRDRTVTVCNGPGNCAQAILADWCRCPGGHVIDLYSDVMTLIDPQFVHNGGVSGAQISW